MSAQRLRTTCPCAISSAGGDAVPVNALAKAGGSCPWCVSLHFFFDPREPLLGSGVNPKPKP